MESKKAIFGLAFGEEQKAPTKGGKERPVRYAEPSPVFWSAWRKHNLIVRAGGFRVFKDKEDQWTVAWWPHLADEESVRKSWAISDYLIEEEKRGELVIWEKQRRAKAALNPESDEQSVETGTGVSLRVIAGGER